MINKIFSLFFIREEGKKITIISQEGREIDRKDIGKKKKPPMSSGVFASFREREKYYQRLFSLYSQQ